MTHRIVQIRPTESWDLHGWIGKTWTFWVFGMFGILAFVFCWFLVPETKGKRLEQIEAYWKNDRQWPDEGDIA